MPTCDVAIIGAGPAGLAAADVLAGRRLDVCLFDENPRPGGQLLRAFRSGAPADAGRFPDPARRRGRRLVQTVPTGVRVETGVQVLGLFPPDRLLVQRGDGKVVEMAARCTICATGARERFIPFPGWTLPGVISTGAAQILLKGAGVLPARVGVIAGIGPLPLLLARQTVAHGGRVAALLDGASLTAKLKLLRTLPGQAAKLAEGLWLTARLAAAGVRVQSGRWITGVSGRGRVESVTTVRLDRRGEAVAGSTRRYPAAGLAVGFGFVPNIELPLQAGCNAHYRVDGGGWVIHADSDLETSLPGVFAAGEVTGIGGGMKSLVEGGLCGLAVSARLGRVKPGDAALRQRLIVRRAREIAFGTHINRLCRVPGAWLAAIPDDTIVCRCEDVRLGDIRRRLADGFGTPGALKKATRCGMGTCQGRVCGPIVDDILAVLAGASHQRQGPPSSRGPVKPVPMGALAAMQRRDPEAG